MRMHYNAAAVPHNVCAIYTYYRYIINVLHSPLPHYNLFTTSRSQLLHNTSIWYYMGLGLGSNPNPNPAICVVTWWKIQIGCSRELASPALLLVLISMSTQFSVLHAINVSSTYLGNNQMFGFISGCHDNIRDSLKTRIYQKITHWFTLR